MPHSVEDIVDFVMNKDHLNIKTTLDAIMSSKVEDALELRKEYVGKQMFNPVEENDETEEDETEVDETEEYEAEQYDTE